MQVVAGAAWLRMNTGGRMRWGGKAKVWERKGTAGMEGLGRGADSWML
jgi:hypothetical protein